MRVVIDERGLGGKLQSQSVRVKEKVNEELKVRGRAETKGEQVGNQEGRQVDRPNKSQ